MEQNKNDPYVQVVGEFLLQHLDKNPQDAEKIFADDKTIAKSLEEMRKVAEKKKVKNCAMFTPQEGFELVMKYFGIETSQDLQKPSDSSKSLGPNSGTGAIDFDIKLVDLL